MSTVYVLTTMGGRRYIGKNYDYKKDNFVKGQHPLKAVAAFDHAEKFDNERQAESFALVHQMKDFSIKAVMFIDNHRA